MEVYVVMGNDFPDSVFTNEKDAEIYCQKRQDENKPDNTKIYWRVYAFKLDEKKGRQS